MWSLLHDLRMGYRLLTRRPRFTLPVLGSFALAIGASTAVFSVVNAVLLRPPRYPEPDRLVTIWDIERRQSPSPMPIDEGAFPTIQESAASFEEIAGFGNWEPVVSSRGRLYRVPAATCTPELFHALRIKPMLGRLFQPSDDEPPGVPVVMLSYSLWQHQFAGDPGIIGRSITVDTYGRKQSLTIVGVMPKEFHFPYPLFPTKPQMWKPYIYPHLPPSHWDHNVYGIGRLKPGMTLRQAQAQMDSTARDLERAFPQGRRGTAIRLVRLQRAIAGNVRQMLLLLLTAAGFVVMIGCANAASLTSALAQARREQLAVRRVLGAGTARLVQQGLAESAVVGLAGGALGVLLAWALLPWLIRLVPHQVFVPGLNNARVDLRVLAFALALTLASTAFAAILPAWRASRQNLSESLKGNLGAEREPRIVDRSGRFLVAGEVALSIGLVVAAGLLLRSFIKLTEVNYGFDPGRLLDVQLFFYHSTVPRNRSDWPVAPPPQINFIRRMQEQAEALPGAKAVGIVDTFPLQDWPALFLMVGQRRSEAAGQQAAMHVVTPGYLRLMGISAIKGRLLEEDDDLNHPAVVVINEAMASKYWRNSDPIGKQLTTRPLLAVEQPWYTIVGVVKDASRLGMEAKPEPVIYTTFYQTPYGRFHLLVASHDSPQNLVRPIRNAALSIAPQDVLVEGSATGSEVFKQSIYRTRFSMFVLSFYGLLALLLAAGGVYSVTSFTVSRRVHEMGVRIALGARPMDIVLMVLVQELWPSVAGVAVGLVAARALDHALASLLFGVGLTDSTTFLVAAFVTLAAAAAACYFPARLAARVDPAIALRYE
jgi:putative ABC transport system permease protein